MAKVNAYINFDGNCFEAFNFYKSVFGGEFTYLGRFSDMPLQEGSPELSADELQRIMHVCLPLSDETMLMGSDTGGGWSENLVTGNNISLSVNADSIEDADQLFNGLSAGGVVTMPMAETFWGDYFGSCTDKFGINWMVSFPLEK